MVTLHASIVNWNTRDALRLCLRSLQSALDGIDSAITVVDNASSDGSAEMVASEFPDVRLLALDSNVGFAAGNNTAIESLPARYVLILNPDVEVPPGGPRELLAFMERCPEVAAVSPLLIGKDGEAHTGYYRRFPTRLQIALFWTRLARVASAIPMVRSRVLEQRFIGSEPALVEQLPGAAMLVSTSSFESIGLMDPDYFVWFEDVDWSYRARLMDAPLYVLPSVRFVHEGGASFSSWDADGRFHHYHRAFFRFLCKHDLRTLRDFALPVINADLRLREAAARARGKDPSVVARTRHEIRKIVAQYEGGKSVRFVDAGSSTSEQP